MNRKSLIIAVAVALLAGCGTKENFVVLSPAGNGSVGALKVETNAGSEVLSEAGKAIFIGDRHAAPSHPTAVDNADTQRIFHDALQVQPLAPESFLLYFNHNSNELTRESNEVVSKIVAAIRKRQSTDISIIGHTDRTGSSEYNRKLSLERAKRVFDILSQETIRTEDMIITYHGEGNPLIPTPDNTPEPRNRRVEVMVR